MNKDRHPMALLSLGLLLAALLGPFVIAAFGSDDAPALGFGVVAGFLSLIFATVSRSEKIGRLVLVLIVALLFVGIVSIPVIRAVRARAVKREQANSEREREAIENRRTMELKRLHN